MTTLMLDLADERGLGKMGKESILLPMTINYFLIINYPGALKNGQAHRH